MQRKRAEGPLNELVVNYASKAPIMLSAYVGIDRRMAENPADLRLARASSWTINIRRGMQLVPSNSLSKSLSVSSAIRG